MDFLISCREISFHFAVIFQCDTVNLLRQSPKRSSPWGCSLETARATRLSWWNQAQHAQDVSVWDYWCGMGPILLKNVTEININRGGSRIFEKGGGHLRRGYRISWRGGGGVKTFTSTPPPLDIVRVTSSTLRKIEKHPHSWTFTSTPLLDIARVTSPTFQGGPWIRHCILGLQAKKGGPTLGPMLKSLHRGPKGGGGVRTPPPPRIRYWSMV